MSAVIRIIAVGVFLFAATDGFARPSLPKRVAAAGSEAASAAPVGAANSQPASRPAAAPTATPGKGGQAPAASASRAPDGEVPVGGAKVPATKGAAAGARRPGGASKDPTQNFEIVEVSDKGIIVRDASGRLMRIADLKDLAAERLRKDVFVTGGKRAQQAWSTLSTVSSLVHDDVEEYPYLFLGDFLSMLPGLDVRWGKMQRLYVGIRGLNGTALSSRVLMLWDGLPLNDPFTGELSAGHFVPMNSIERIEVIRGPGSTLYGANAYSGVVNLITDTSLRSYLRAELLTGSFRTARAQASFKQPVGAFVFSGGAEAFRTDGPFPEKEKRDGTGVEFIKNDDVKQVSVHGEMRLADFRLSARYTGGERGRPGTFRTDSHGRILECSSCHNSSSPYGQGVKYPATDRACGSCHVQPDNREQTHRFNVIANYLHRFSRDLAAEASAYHNQSRTEYSIRQHDGFLQNSRLTPQLNQMLSGGEAHLTHRFKDINSVVAGAEARHFEAFSQLIRSPSGTSAGQTEVAGFLEDELRPWSWLSLTGGTRFDYNTTFGSAVSPRGGLMILPMAGLAIRATVGRAFRNPSLSELHVVDERGRYTVRGNADLKREWITSVEGGISYTLTDPIKLHVAGTFFYNAADDLISFRAVDVDSATFFNIDRVHALGTELEVQAQFFDRPKLALFANYSYQRLRTADGEGLPYAPESKLNAGFRLRHKKVGGSLRLRFVGARSDNLGIELPSFLTLDASMQLMLWKSIMAQLWVQNIAGHEYQESLGIPAAPRSVYLSLRYDSR